jgi:hypothetical protein
VISGRFAGQYKTTTTSIVTTTTLPVLGCCDGEKCVLDTKPPEDCKQTCYGNEDCAPIEYKGCCYEKACLLDLKKCEDLGIKPDCFEDKECET